MLYDERSCSGWPRSFTVHSAGHCAFHIIMTSLVVNQDAPVELQRHVTHVLQLHASHTIQHTLGKLFTHHTAHLGQVVHMPYSTPWASCSHTIQHTGIHSLANTSCLDEEITQSTTSDHQMRERPKTCSEGNTKLDWIKGKSFAAIS